MPVKKVTTRKSAVKKDAPATKRTKKIELKEFLKEVEKKAYERFQERMKSGVFGDEISDWFQAEKEIKEKYKL
jgi:hypothetical protein